MNPLELVTKTLLSFNEKDLAFQVLEVFGKNSKTFEQYDQIAKSFFELKEFKKAIKYAEKSLDFIPSAEHEYITKKNLINAYNQSNQPEKSIDLIKELKTTHHHGDDELLLEETFAYSALGNKDESNSLLFDLLKKPLSEKIKRKAYHNLSGYFFRKDDLYNGLKHFLKEGEKEAYKNKKLPSYKKWNGEIIPGKTLIIDNECGAGDEVMHIRFMDHIKRLGMNPIWTSTRRELVELFNHNGYESVCIYDNPEFPSDSFWVYSLAIPYYLNTKVEDLYSGPYLKTLPELDKKWEWIKKDKSYKIGIFTASSSGFEQNEFRSVDLNDLMKAFEETNFSLYSLQMPNELSQVNLYPEINQSLSVPDRSFSDTFSIINNLDLVITSCSFTAHVAASLGKEVCVFVPIMEYYVWTSSTGKSWWYGDNVHLFRQKRPRVWDEPIEELKIFLNDRKV